MSYVKHTHSFRDAMNVFPQIHTQVRISEMEIERAQSIDVVEYHKSHMARLLAEEVHKTGRMGIYRAEEVEKLEIDPFGQPMRIYRSDNYVLTPKELAELLASFGESLLSEFGMVRRIEKGRETQGIQPIPQNSERQADPSETGSKL